MPSLIAHLSKSEQKQLLEDLNYLNMQEFRSFCREHSIPFTIFVETHAGERRRTNDTDRKAVVLDRIRRYLKTGKIEEPTCFAAEAVRLGGFKGPVKPTDRLYYGCYDKKNASLMRLLKDLTGGKFRDGAIGRILMREFWTAGKAPTMREYAKAWTQANDKGLGFHPEAAWLTDRARGEAGADWKAKRTRIAKRALRVLGQIEPQA